MPTPPVQIDANDLIARYQQALADQTHRALVAEAAAAAARVEIDRLNGELATAAGSVASE